MKSVQMSQNRNDNRMEWVRILEQLNKKEKDEHVYMEEYEILSECKILGRLEYMGNKIVCTSLDPGGDPNDGLYSYLLEIKWSKQREYNIKNANKEGYYFKNGVVGELLALFSLFFRCRFYLESTTTYLGKRSRIKRKHKFTRRYCNPAIHPPIFEGNNRNFAVELAGFLDKIRKIDSKYHQQFILACNHYLRALQEVGIDLAMVYIRLVSAVETLSKSFKLKGKDDPLHGKKIKDLIKGTGLSCSLEESDALRSLFDLRKSQKKFERFIERHSKGFFKGGNYRRKNQIITKKNLLKTLKKIYKARSGYLHNGEPMYLGIRTRDRNRADIGPPLDMIIDNRKFSSSRMLPFAFYFEGLVRHCLLNFLKDNIN